MELTSDVIDYKVITNRGIVPVSTINIGDHVYDYISGNSLEVKGIEKTEKMDSYLIFYTDRRVVQHLSADFIFTGDKIMQVQSILEKMKKSNGEVNIFSHLIQHRIEFDKGTVKPPIVNPDPYIAGMFYAFGDFYDEYANLPITLKEANRMLLGRYNYSLNDINGSFKIYFTRLLDSDPLKWEEMFTDGFQYENWYDNKVNSSYRDIPDRFKYGTIKERIQFITGIFDAGFHPELTGTSVGITGNERHVLEEIQRLLWSLGISSMILYDPDLHALNGIDYKLHVLKTDERFPVFFYNIDKISRILEQSNEMGKGEAIHYTVPTKITKVTDSYSYHIILEKPKQLFLTSNFMPRVSM